MAASTAFQFTLVAFYKVRCAREFDYLAEQAQYMAG